MFKHIYTKHRSKKNRDSSQKIDRLKLQKYILLRNLFLLHIEMIRENKEKKRKKRLILVTVFLNYQQGVLDY